MPPDLGGVVDTLLATSALGALGLARKAGAVALGAAKVEARCAAARRCWCCTPPRPRKTACARSPRRSRATAHAGGPEIPAYKLFSEAELGLALGGTNVIHAAVLAGDAGQAALKSAWLRLTDTGAVPRMTGNVCGDC